jgi:nicotinamide riboside kinase
VRVYDRYLARDLRVRLIGEVGGGDKYYLCRKKGSKSAGFREETETLISGDVANILADQAKLTVSKIRHGVLLPDGGKITVDFVDLPMRLGIIEVEHMSEAASPITNDEVRMIFKHDLTPCPLSAWDLFRRRIGICGAPSSGKTETAKQMSFILTTQYQANAFFVPEYATSFIQKYNSSPTFYDQIWIWQGQRTREEDAAVRANVVLSDCPVFLAYIYALMLRDKPLDSNLAFHVSKLYKRVLYDSLRYTDLILLKLQDYVKNNVRYHTASQALQIEGRIRGFLLDHGIRFTEATYDDTEALLKKLFYLND